MKSEKKRICLRAEAILSGLVNPQKYIPGYQIGCAGPFTGARFYFASGHGVGSPAMGGGHGTSGPFFIPSSDTQEPTNADVVLAKRIISEAETAASSREAAVNLREEAWRGFQAAFRGVPYRIGKTVWLGLEIEVPRDKRGQPDPRKTRVVWKGEVLHCYSDPEKVTAFLAEANIPLREEMRAALSAYHSGYASEEQVNLLNEVDDFLKNELGLVGEAAEQSFAFGD